MEILDFGKINLLITENKFPNRCLGLSRYINIYIRGVAENLSRIAFEKIFTCKKHDATQIKAAFLFGGFAHAA